MGILIRIICDQWEYTPSYRYYSDSPPLSTLNISGLGTSEFGEYEHSCVF